MNWYVVNTKPRKESVVEITLRQLNVETFSPKFKEKRVIRKQYQAVVGPLFPGYIFAKFDVDTQYRMVQFAHGVKQVVSNGASPAQISESEILMLQSRLREGYIVLQPSRFNPGQPLRIKEGPFEGLEAIFEREMTAQNRVVLLMKTLKYQPQVVVKRECVTVFS